MSSRRAGIPRTVALLAAFAILFAPADDGAVGNAREERDIASRILAPTVRQAVSAAIRKETPPRLPEAVPVAVALAAAAVPFIWRFLTYRAAAARWSVLLSHRPAAPRAPPALQGA